MTEIELRLSPTEAHDEAAIKQAVAFKLELSERFSRNKRVSYILQIP
jgi:hypothetical protein